MAQFSVRCRIRFRGSGKFMFSVTFRVGFRVRFRLWVRIFNQYVQYRYVGLGLGLTYQLQDYR